VVARIAGLLEHARVKPGSLGHALPRWAKRLMGAYSLVAFPQAVNEAPRHNWPRCHPLPQCGHVRAKDGCSAAAVRLVGQRRRHLKPMWLVSIEELQLKTTMWWPVDWGWVEWLSHHNRYQPGSLPREVFPRGSPPSIFECASAAHLLGARCARRTKLGILGSAHIICEILWGLLSLVVVEWRSEYSSFRLEEGWRQVSLQAKSHWIVRMLFDWWQSVRSSECSAIVCWNLVSTPAGSYSGRENALSSLRSSLSFI